MKKVLGLLVITGVITIGVVSFLGRSAQNPAALSSVESGTEINMAVAPRVIHTVNVERPVASAIQAPATPVPAPPKPTRQEIISQLTQAIKSALNSTNAADHDQVFTNLLPALIAQDPVAAGRLAESLDPGDGRQELLRRAAQGWAGVDATGAVAWAASLANTDEQKSALIDVSFQIAQSDPAQAITLAEHYDLGGANGTMGNLAQLWAGKDWPAALDWATRQTAGDQRDQIFGRLAYVQSQTAPVDAMNLIIDQMPPGSAQNEAAMSVLHQWGLGDFAAASAWAAQLSPDGPLADRVNQELAGIAAYRQALNH